VVKEMFKEQRTDKVLDIIRENKYVTVEYLVSRLHYSPATIRRDITYLSNLGLVKKSYGGVSIAGGKPAIIREHENIAGKVKVCKCASDFVKDGDMVFIDGATTTYFLGEYLLKKKNVTVVTTNIKLAMFLGEHKVECYVCGGRVHDSTMLSGSLVASMIEKFRFDVAFFSVGSINLQGQFAIYEQFWDFMKTAFINSKNNVLLCDSEKISDNEKMYSDNLSVFDTVVCDCKMPNSIYDKFKDIRFIVAE
jgi:DeoR/GlpR family transcriptional regulator of sugar metabolism